MLPPLAARFGDSLSAEVANSALENDPSLPAERRTPPGSFASKGHDQWQSRPGPKSRFEPRFTPAGKHDRTRHSACSASQSLGLNAGARSNIGVAAFGKFFLTLPLSRSQSDLYVELVDLVKPSDAVNLDMVQLYR